MAKVVISKGKKVDEPAVVRGRKQAAVTTAVHGGETKRAGKGKLEGNGQDKYGFRIGTKRSDVMEMLSAGKYTWSDITQKLDPLTNKQIKSIAEIAGKEIIESNSGKLSLRR
jgi:hypothetical protein